MTQEALLAVILVVLAGACLGNSFVCLILWFRADNVEAAIEARNKDESKG